MAKFKIIGVYKLLTHFGPYPTAKIIVVQYVEWRKSIAVNRKEQVFISQKSLRDRLVANGYSEKDAEHHLDLMIAEKFIVGGRYDSMRISPEPRGSHDDVTFPSNPLEPLEPSEPFQPSKPLEFLETIEPSKNSEPLSSVSGYLMSLEGRTNDENQDASDSPDPLRQILQPHSDEEMEMTRLFNQALETGNQEIIERAKSLLYSRRMKIQDVK